MKNHVISAHTINTSIVFTVLMGVQVRIDAQQEDLINLSFDSIFPTTPYKDALGSCMQVLGYLEQLSHECAKPDSKQEVLLYDALLGKIVSAQYKVIHLVTTIKDGLVVADDNVQYLDTLVHYINTVYQERITHVHHNALVVDILKDISKELSYVHAL